MLDDFVFLLGKYNISKLKFDVIDSWFILMNSGHVDWRTYKISLEKSLQIPFTSFFKVVNNNMVIIISSIGQSSLINLN